MVKGPCHMTWEIVTDDHRALDREIKALSNVVGAKWVKGTWRPVEDDEPQPEPCTTVEAVE